MLKWLCKDLEQYYKVKRDFPIHTKPGMGLESKEEAPETQKTGRQAIKQKENSHSLESWWLALQSMKRSKESG